MRKAFYCIISLTAILFIVHFVFCVRIGGNALSGYEQDGVYYVVSHQHPTAVSYSVWIANLVIGIAALVMGGLSLLLCLLFPNLPLKDGKVPLHLRAQSIIAADDAVWDQNTVRTHIICFYRGLFFAAVCICLVILFLLLNNTHMLIVPILAAIFSITSSWLFYRNYRIDYDQNGITLHPVWGKSLYISQNQIIDVYPSRKRFKGRFQDVVIILYRNGHSNSLITSQETIYVYQQVGVARFLEFARREYNLRQSSD